MMRVILKKFSTQDLLYMAIFAALGLAIKPLVTPLIHLFSAPLLIPGGSLAGGFYMMWLALVVAIVNKTGTGTLFGVIQAIVVIALGYFGNHGAVSLLSYTLPGIVADGIAIFLRPKNSLFAQVLICTLANLCGVLVVTILVMRLAFIPLLIALVAAAISGIAGGVVSRLLFVKLKQYRII